MWTDKVQAQMSYSSVTQKMTLHMTPNTVFTIRHHSATASMLGFRKSVVTTPLVVVATDAESTRVRPSISSIPPPPHPSDDSYPFHNEADDVVNMTHGLDTIYINTDVVESRIVGDSLAPLLRTLSISGRHGDTVSDRFTNIHYVPLMYSHFHSIEVDIRDDTERRVPFEYGRVKVTLHFRRRRTGLF